MMSVSTKLLPSPAIVIAGVPGRRGGAFFGEKI